MPTQLMHAHPTDAHSGSIPIQLLGLISPIMRSTSGAHYDELIAPNN